MNTCVGCEVEFVPTKHNPGQKFCSGACRDSYYARMSRPKFKACVAVGCQAIFTPARRSQKYCSERCRRRQSKLRAHRSRMEMPLRACDARGCDTEFTPKSRVHRFCSSRCCGRQGAWDRYRDPEVAERHRAANRAYHRYARKARLKARRLLYASNAEYEKARQKQYHASPRGQWVSQLRRRGWVVIYTDKLSEPEVRGLGDAILCESPSQGLAVIGRLMKHAAAG